MPNWLVTYTHPAFPGALREMIIQATTYEEATTTFENASNELGFHSRVTVFRNLDGDPEPKPKRGKDYA